MITVKTSVIHDVTAFHRDIQGEIAMLPNISFYGGLSPEDLFIVSDISDNSNKKSVYASDIASVVSIDAISDGQIFKKLPVSEYNKLLTIEAYADKTGILNVTTALASIDISSMQDITSPGTDIENAVFLRHPQGTDTTLGILTADIDAGTHGIFDLNYLSLGMLGTGAGRFSIEMSANNGDFDVVLINSPHNQTTVYRLSDAGVGGATIPSNRNLHKLLFDTALDNTVVSVPGSGTLIFNDDPLIINAVHLDIPDEISSITDKLYPVIGDVYLLEDSEDSNSKKSATGENIAKSFDMDLFQEGVTYKKYSLLEQEKLAGIEAGADITDVDNVTTALASIVVASLQDVTSAGEDIDNAVWLRHAQGTDTTMGIMTADINMNGHSVTNDPNLQDLVHTDVANEFSSLISTAPFWDSRFLFELEVDGSKRRTTPLGLAQTTNVYNQLDEYAQTVTGQEFLSIEHPTTGWKYSMLVDDIFFRRAFYESTIPFTTGVMYVEWFDGSVGSIRNYHFLHKLTNTVSGEEQTYEVLVNVPQDVFSDTVYNKPKPYIEITNLSYEQTPWLEEVVVQSSIAGQAVIHFHYTDITNLTFEFLNLYDSTNKVPSTAVASQSSRPINLKQTIDVKLRKTSSVDGIGSVKIISNGDTSKPTYSLSPGVPQQITYTGPLLDSEVFYPETALAKDVTNIYGDTGGHTGIFQENPVLGQPQYWRVAFDYSGKTLLSNAGLYVSLYNPVNGFTTQIPLTLPAGENAHTNLAVDIATFADHNSLGAPYGSGAGGYQLFFESTQESVNIVVQSVARLTWR